MTRDRVTVATACRMAATACMTAALIARPSLVAQPARGLPSPSTGWLIISGPPGAAPSCDVTRAYNIETGGAFVHDGCSGRTAAGTLPAATIREALSALLSRVPEPWTGERRTRAHTWRWVVSDELSLIGDVPWPDAPNGGEDTAVARVRAAEAHLTEGCAPPLPPPSHVLAATLPRMVNPVSADQSQELTARYRSARERWTRLNTCGD